LAEKIKFNFTPEEKVESLDYYWNSGMVDATLPGPAIVIKVLTVDLNL